MAYASWSVVFGEQPSAAKWNILGSNDASFNDGTGISNLAWNVTALSNPYKFRASRNAAANTGNAAFAVVAFDTEQYDTNSNHSAGVYTAPVAGFYQFNWNITMNGTGSSSEYITALFKNGTRTTDGGHISIAASTTGLHGSDIIQLAASDTVDIRAFNGSAAVALIVGSIYDCYFSGFLVSRT